MRAFLSETAPAVPSFVSLSLFGYGLLKFVGAM